MKDGDRTRQAIAPGEVALANEDPPEPEPHPYYATAPHSHFSANVKTSRVRSS